VLLNTLDAVLKAVSTIPSFQKRSRWHGEREKKTIPDFTTIRKEICHKD